MMHGHYSLFAFIQDSYADPVQEHNFKIYIYSLYTKFNHYKVSLIILLLSSRDDLSWKVVRIF